MSEAYARGDHCCTTSGYRPMVGEVGGELPALERFVFLDGPDWVRGLFVVVDL